jgi:hypothetical protein
MLAFSVVEPLDVFQGSRLDPGVRGGANALPPLVLDEHDGQVEPAFTDWSTRYQAPPYSIWAASGLT